MLGIGARYWLTTGHQCAQRVIRKKRPRGLGCKKKYVDQMGSFFQKKGSHEPQSNGVKFSTKKSKTQTRPSRGRRNHIKRSEGGWWGWGVLMHFGGVKKTCASGEA